MNALARRQHLRDLLSRTPAASQQGLVDALASSGIVVTQTTISRDLAAIGAIKSRSGYALPHTPSPVITQPMNGTPITNTLRHHTISITQADSIVVIRTAPGHASLVADVLDKAPPEGVVATVAGDDTIFVATTSRSTALRVANELNKPLLGTKENH